MKILIAGAGKVGYHLAKTLSIVHDVTIVDKNVKTISKIQENLDVLAIHGNIKNPTIFFQLDKNIDFFIAVTDSDEVNLIACLIIDDIINVQKKIVRLKNSFFQESAILKTLNIYDTIFPSTYTANTVKYLLEFPNANNVKAFEQSKMLLLSVKINNPEFVGYNIREIHKKFNDNIMVVGQESDKAFSIPSPTDLVKQGDLLYLFGAKELIRDNYCDFEEQYGLHSTVKNCIIFGADNLGIEIAKVLIEKKLNIKIIDKDLEKCKKAIDILQDKVTVLNSRYGWGHLLKEEGLDNADILIASTPDDEYNMIKCIEGRKSGIKKVIAINNDREYYSLMHSLDMVVVRGEKINSHYAILESLNSSHLIKERRYCGDRAILFNKQITLDSPLLHQTINIPTKILELAMVTLVRNEEIITELEERSYQEGDTLALFSTLENENVIKNWLQKEI